MNTRASKRIIVAVLAALLMVVTGTAAAQDEAPARGFLGVALTDSDGGALVTQVVPDSPADLAGIRVGDVISAVNGTVTPNAQAVVEAISALSAGDQAEVTTIFRDVERVFTVTLAQVPEAPVRDVRVIPRADIPFGFAFRGGDFDLAYTPEGWQINALPEASALYEAGVRAGDLITAIDGDLLTPNELFIYLREQGADATVMLTIERDGETQELEAPARAVLALPMPLGEGMFMLPRGFERGVPFGGVRLGVTFITLSETVASERELNVTAGALITEVIAESPAAEAGLQVDDVITAVNGEALTEDFTLRDAIMAADTGDVVELTVLRADETFSLTVSLAEPRLPLNMMRQLPNLRGLPFGVMPRLDQLLDRLPLDELHFGELMPFGEGFQFQLPLPGGRGAPNV